MKARYVQRGDAIDYTPMEDVAAGDVVVLSGKLVGVAKLDIKAGELGALALVGVYEFAKAEGIAFAAGMEVGWNASTGQAVAAGASREPFLPGGACVRRRTAPRAAPPPLPSCR